MQKEHKAHYMSKTTYFGDFPRCNPPHPDRLTRIKNRGERHNCHYRALKFIKVYASEFRSRGRDIVDVRSHRFPFAFDRRPVVDGDPERRRGPGSLADGEPLDLLFEEVADHRGEMHIRPLGPQGHPPVERRIEWDVEPFGPGIVDTIGRRPVRTHGPPHSRPSFFRFAHVTRSVARSNVLT